MRFLIDNAFSPRIAHILRDHGYDAFHVRECGLTTASDVKIVEVAEAESRIVVTADNDFADILVREHLLSPSVILIREDRPHRAQLIADLLLLNLPGLESSLLEGSLVVIRQTRVRIRELPILPE